MITLEERVSISYKELIKEILTCGTCLNVYDRSHHSPRLLNCSHSVCDECLEKYCNRAKEEGSESFDCPICRRKNKISTSYLVDFRTNQLLDLVDRQGRELVPRCSDHSLQELFFCELCNTLFRGFCDKISHDNLNSENHEHKVSNRVLKTELHNSPKSSSDLYSLGTKKSKFV